MHILITDSGVGGLSVVAYAERFVRTRGFTEPVRLTFANAAPANDYGYNSMPSHAMKIETFDRFLRSVARRFAPDRIYVACNTLSVLLPEVQAPVPIQGIIETGVARVADALAPESIALIFGTQTTIDAGTYPRLLEALGVDAARIVSQACPGLADVISEDREGARAEAEIRRWVGEAMGKIRATRPIVACLACTHYGYRKEFFAAALGDAVVINPNESAVDDLFPRGGAIHDVDVDFVTRYALPPATVETLTWLLGDISPRTVAAMQSFVHVPDLF
jgi:glutamate racemase